MKRSRSFENLRTPERKVTFDEAEGATDSYTPSSSPSPPPRNEEGEDNPVQVSVLFCWALETGCCFFL